MINTRQMKALSFVAILASTLRIIPEYSAELSGSACWLTPAAALPVLLLFVWLVSAVMRNRRSGEGLGEMIMRCCGRTGGAAILFIFAAYMLFCIAFLLRASAERYISTIYPSSDPWPFIVVMLLLGLIAALGPAKAVIRAAKIFAPIVLIAMLFALIFAFSSVDMNNFQPVRAENAPDILKGAVPVVDVVGGGLLFPLFFEWCSIPEQHRFKKYLPWLLLVCALLTILCTAAVGNYSAPVVAEMSHPFFTMLRDITIFRTIERIEAFVVALWVMPDFIVIAVLLSGAARALRLALGYNGNESEVRMLSMADGRWLIPLCAAICAACLALISQDAIELTKLSHTVIPLGNLALMFFVLPLCYIIGKIRKKI